MQPFIFFGYAYRPQSEYKNELKTYFETYGFEIEMLSERAEIYYAQSTNSLSLPEVWDFLYSIPSHYAEFIEPDLCNQALSKKSSFIDCDLPHKPGSEHYNWAKAQIRIEDTWRLPLYYPNSRHRAEGIRIGHTDTGYTSHREIKNAQLRTDLGWDYYENDQDAYDRKRSGNFGHGTSTGSLIISDGDIGGAAPGAELVPIRVDVSVIVNLRNLVRGFDFAIYRECLVTSTSMGNVSTDGSAVNAILREAISNGIIPVAAAGQFAGAPVSIFPAQSPYCIGCTGSNVHLTPWKKGFKSPYIRVAAPGESVWVADADSNSIGRYCGTSFSTALTASTAANWYAYWSENLLWERYGKGKVFSVFAYLLSKYGIKPWSFEGFGPGILDAYALFTMKKAELPSLAEIDEFEAILFTEPTQIEKTCALMGMIQPEQLLNSLTRIFFQLSREETIRMIDEYGSEIRGILIIADDVRNRVLGHLNNESDDKLQYEKTRELFIQYCSTKLSTYLNA